MTVWAIVKTRFEGHHRWNDAPIEVEFLQNLHRHIFFVEVQISQLHNERDIEYFIFKNWLDEKIFNNKVKFTETDSCETMATKIKKIVEKKYKRKVKVKITEDGESGALVE